jgi:hypothetical protein
LNEDYVTFDDKEQNIFNSVIQDQEIDEDVNNLKIGKASGRNLITQQLVYGGTVLLPYIRRPFNILFVNVVFRTNGRT